MQTIFSKRNKKSFIVLQEAVILVAAAFLLVGLIWFFYQLQSALFAEPDDGSIANLRRLHANIVELMESPDTRDYKIMSFFIGENKALVGFDTDSDADTFYADNVIYPFDKFFDVTHNKIFRPLACGTAACLCLYDDDRVLDEEEDRDKNVIECKRLKFSGKKITIHTGPVSNDLNEGVTSEVQQIYIEKLVNNPTRTSILVLKIDINDVNNLANIRKKEIDDSS